MGKSLKLGKCWLKSSFKIECWDQKCSINMFVTWTFPYTVFGSKADGIKRQSMNWYKQINKDHVYKTVTTMYRLYIVFLTSKA